MPDSLAEVTRRLHDEFPSVGLGEVIEVVRSCREEIDTGMPTDCIPELVERLARVRLSDRDLAAGSTYPSGHRHRPQEAR